MRLDEEAVVDGLAPHAPDEAEVVQVVRLVLGGSVDLVRIALAHERKHGVVWVHYLPRDEHEPVARQTAVVAAILALELDL